MPITTEKSQPKCEQETRPKDDRVFILKEDFEVFLAAVGRVAGRCGARDPDDRIEEVLRREFGKNLV